jgi:alkyl hydroperoxide reductase subunit AhpC
VFFFYPLDFAFMRPTEVAAFSNKANGFHDMNCHETPLWPSCLDQYTNEDWEVGPHECPSQI